jgi:hypothetical protein
MRFTYAYITYKKEVFDQHLGPCLNKIKDKVDVITKENIIPAKFHNEVLKESNNRYIIFSHEDVTFTPDIIDQIEKTIEQLPSFGVLCVVGRNDENVIIGSVNNKIRNLKFCDPCFFVIDKENPLRFDEITFDDFHLSVEDYCVGSQELHGKGTYTILITWNKEEDSLSFKHHSYTCKSVKYKWGKYEEHKKKFKEKWSYLENIKKF